jgi:hypothetical protein
MRESTDRCLQMIKEVKDLLIQSKKKELHERARKHFEETLEKLWPLKSNEKPN